MLIPFFSFKGSHIFQKLRPVDQLRHLLVSCVGGESEEVERFFKLHRVQSIKITDSCFFFFFFKHLPVMAFTRKPVPEIFKR